MGVGTTRVIMSNKRVIIANFIASIIYKLKLLLAQIIKNRMFYLWRKYEHNAPVLFLSFFYDCIPRILASNKQVQIERERVGMRVYF